MKEPTRSVLQMRQPVPGIIVTSRRSFGPKRTDDMPMRQWYLVPAVAFETAGFEPYSEALAASLLSAARVSHVPYSVVRFHGKLASKCPLFTTEDMGFVSAHRFFDGPFDVDDMLAFCADHGTEEHFREMVVMDAVMATVMT